MNQHTQGPRILAVAAVLAGCASATLPVARVASTEAAMRSAQDSGATHTPNAALHLHYADMERQEAQRLMSDHDNERAAMQLRRAEADANLALALSREASVAQAAQAAGDPSTPMPSPAANVPTRGSP